MERGGAEGYVQNTLIEKQYREQIISPAEKRLRRDFYSEDEKDLVFKGERRVRAVSSR